MKMQYGFLKGEPVGQPIRLRFEQTTLLEESHLLDHSKLSSFHGIVVYSTCKS
jgi:hypothetical protein